MGGLSIFFNENSPAVKKKSFKMDKIWGKCKEPTKLEIAEGDDKAAIRKKEWEFMEKNDIANFPRPVYNRIPNFKGANLAGQKVKDLKEFQTAKTVKVNPDKPQEEVRYQVLDHNKDLIVPTPRLSKGLFNRLSAEPGMDKENMRKLASREGIDHQSKPVPMASRIKLDLVVVGSVAVDKSGNRIGKGEGFADLEFAMAVSHHGAITKDTLVLSTVHDVQVFDQIPESLFQPHDLSVDIIVTPTEVFRVEEPKKPKPDHIIWNLLSREKFDQIPILKEIRFKEKKAGKDTILKDEDEKTTDSEENSNNKKVFTKKSPRKPKNNSKKRLENGNKKQEETENNGNITSENGDNPTKNGNNSTKLNGNEKNHQENEEGNEKQIGSKKTPNFKKSNKKPKSHNTTVGVFIGKIPRGTRVKELKETIIDRGVRPVNVLWKGAKGYAMIYFEKKNDEVTSQDLCAQLKDLKIGDNFLNVEPDKRGASSSGISKDESTTPQDLTKNTDKEVK